MCAWMGGPGMGFGSGHWFGGGLLMMLPMLLFWGLILWGGFVLIRKLGKERQFVQPEAALETLKMRYAKGEINQEEFEMMKRSLEA